MRYFTGYLKEESDYVTLDACNALPQQWFFSIF